MAVPEVLQEQQGLRARQEPQEPQVQRAARAARQEPQEQPGVPEAQAVPEALLQKRWERKVLPELPH